MALADKDVVRFVLRGRNRELWIVRRGPFGAQVRYLAESGPEIARLLGRTRRHRSIPRKGMVGMRNARSASTLVTLATTTLFVLASCSPSGAGSPAATASAASTTQSTPSAAAPKLPAVLRIGIAKPFTGNLALFGSLAKQGAELALERLNGQNYIPGTRFEVAYEDDRDNATEAANIAQKFVGDSSIIAVIGDFSSTATLAAAPIYQAGKLPFVAETAASPDVPKQGNFIFQMAVTTVFESQFIANWAVKDLKAKKVAFIGPNNDFTSAAAKPFIDHAKALGAEVVANESYQPGEKDFRPLLTKLRGLQPDIVGTAAQFTEQALIDQQAKAVGLTAKFVAGGSLFSDDYIKQASGAAEGNYVATPFWPGSERQAAKDFFAAYKQKYGSDPNKFPAFTYDVVVAIAQAVKGAGAADRAKVRDALSTVKFKGVIGDELAFNADRVVQGIQEERLVVSGGKFTLWKP